MDTVRLERAASRLPDLTIRQAFCASWYAAAAPPAKPAGRAGSYRNAISTGTANVFPSGPSRYASPRPPGASLVIGVIVKVVARRDGVGGKREGHLPVLAGERPSGRADARGDGLAGRRPDLRHGDDGRARGQGKGRGVARAGELPRRVPYLFDSPVSVSRTTTSYATFESAP